MVTTLLLAGFLDELLTTFGVTIYVVNVSSEN
jgi:hypothetical protein